MTINKTGRNCNLCYEEMPLPYIKKRLVFDENLKVNDFIFIDINQAFLKLSGLKKEDVQDHRFTELFSDLADPAFHFVFSHFEQTYKTGSKDQFEVFFSSFNRWFELTIFLDDNKDVITIIFEITEKKIIQERLKKSELSFRSLYENSNVGLYRTTPEGHIVMANPALIKVMGYNSFEEIAMRNLEDEGFPEGYYRDTFKDLIEKHGSVRNLESVWISNEGKEIYVSESANALRDESGRIIYYEGSIVDITEKKIAEKQIRQLNNIFNEFGVDPGQNIDLIVKKTCDILNSFSSVYSIIDPSGNKFTVYSQFNSPFPQSGLTDTDGHICYELTVKSSVQPVCIEDFGKSIFSNIDPWVKKYQLKSYLGHIVNPDEKVVGSLCVVDLKPRTYTETEKQIIATLAKALSLEHKRILLEQELKDSAEKYRSFVNNFHGIAFRGDLRFVPFFFHGNVENITGFKEEDFLTGKINWRMVVHPGDMRKLLLETRELGIREGVTVENEYRIIRKDGETRWVRQYLHNLCDEKHQPYAVEGVIYDISNIKEFEESLRTAKEEAEEANKAKSQFLANISHEIRTPLNAILGFSDILLGQGQDESSAKMLKTIQDSGTQLLSIIHDLLDLSRIEAGKITIHPEPCDIHELIGDSIRFFENILMDKNLKVFYDDTNLKDLLFIGDQLKIKQIVVNLLSNAIKFTNQGYIEVQTEELPLTQSRSTIIIRVKDTGIGIPEEHLEDIFNAFHQVDHYLTKTQKGTGLGLTISRKLAELMGGTLSVSSKVGHGSTFTLRLALETAGKKTAANISQPIEELKEVPLPDHLRILLAEDNENNQFLIQALTRLKNWDLDMVENGRDAVNLYMQNKYDLILMDVQMPEVNGFDATVLIREMEKLSGRHTPIIALTGFAMKSDYDKCIEAGMDNYISKPFKREQFFNTISKTLGILNA